MPLSLDGSDWPMIAVEIRCDTCERLINSEGVRPVTLANYPTIAWWWRDRIMAHLASCPGKPAADAPKGDA